jgi:cation transport regulator ChaB/predicted RNA-binding Zn-ribbon protein involved in translation (DUF1610 family)
MTTINDIFRMFGPEYLLRFSTYMPANHKKIIRAITDCRTENYGTNVYECEKCGKYHILFRSCGNRHCPACQGFKSHQWVEKQLEKQLPGHHFMITFTVPEQIRHFIRSHQRKTYTALFNAASSAMKKLAKDEKYIGGDLPGFFGILHTWGRQLQYHPHIHFIVTGGAISKATGFWHTSRIDFYLPVRALSKIFKAKFKEQMDKAHLLASIPNEAWAINWNVNCQAVGSSEHSIKYLSRYVFKVAMSNSRIVKLEDRKVFFKYQKQKSQRWRTAQLDVMEFIRRFLQHVLPTGFMKIRYYGFMHPGCSVDLNEISARIQMAYGFEINTSKPETEPPAPFLCPDCGGNLLFRTSVIPCRRFSASSG